MTDWDKVYKVNRMTMWEPQQAIVQFVNRYIKQRIKYDEYKIIRDIAKCLDLGCGNGSAVHFLAKNGFETYGIDISEEAIKVGNNYLKEENIKAELKVTSCDSLPFEDNYFDFIISYGVLDHVEINIANKSIEEVKRVLKSKGLFFITLCSVNSSLFCNGNKTGKHTYFLEEGPEKGEIQHYFDIEEIRELLQGFKIIDLRQSIEHKYDKNLNIVKTSARWLVTSELQDE